MNRRRIHLPHRSNILVDSANANAPTRILYTSTARSIGMERHAYLVTFFSQPEGEMTGDQ